MRGHIPTNTSFTPPSHGLPPWWLIVGGIVVGVGIGLLIVLGP